MNSQAQEEKMQLRQMYPNTWHTDLMHTCGAEPAYCCFAFFCSPCASYSLRKRALYDDMSRYVCCAGYMPCSGRCGEQKAPQFCLFCEVMLCFNNSVSSTRWLIQDEFNIQTTQCDNCLIAFMFCINQLACICSLLACLLGSEELNDGAEMLKCLANLVSVSVCACMQTQHKIELDKRDGKFGPAEVMTAPPVQAMSRLDQQYPPTVGYQPHPSSSPYALPPAQPDQPHPPVGGYTPPPQHPDQPYPPSAIYPPYENHPDQPYPPLAYPPPHGQPPYEHHPDQPYPPSAYPPPHGQPPYGYISTHYPSQPQGYPPAPYPSPSAYPPMGYPPSNYAPSGQPPN